MTVDWILFKIFLTRFEYSFRSNGQAALGLWIYAAEAFGRNQSVNC